MAISGQRAMEIVRRRQQVSDLYLQGWTQTDIADRLRVTQATICGDLKKIREAWLDSMIRDFDQARAQELQKIEHLERESWAAWERSQKPSQSAVIQGEGGAQATRKTVKNQHGDPRFLDQIHKCIASRRAILGLDAPQKIMPTDAEGRGLNVTDLLSLALATDSAAPRANVIDVQAELARDRELSAPQPLTQTPNAEPSHEDERH